MIFRCDYCRKRFDRPLAQRRCPHSYCSQRCTGLARRTHKTKTQRVAAKAAYDRQYRLDNLKRLRRQKREHYVRTFDAEKARKARKGKAKQHAEYIRRYYQDPKNKAAKVKYDADRRSALFGPFAGAYKVYLLLKRRVLAQLPDKYERLKQMGYYDNQKERANGA